MFSEKKPHKNEFTIASQRHQYMPLQAVIKWTP